MKIGLIIFIILALFNVVICTVPTYLPKKTLNQSLQKVYESLKIVIDIYLQTDSISNFQTAYDDATLKVTKSKVRTGHNIG